MKRYFDFKLEGKDLFILMLPMIVLTSVNFYFKHICEPSTSLSVISFANNLIIIIFNVQILRKKIEFTYFDNKKSEFVNTPQNLFAVTFENMLYSIISLGIYFPWAERNIFRYVAENTSYNGKKFSFESKGLKLFLAILCFFGSFMLIALFFGIISGYSKASGGNEVSPYIFAPILVILTILGTSFFLAFFAKWLVNFKFSDYEIKINTSITELGIFIFKEVIKMIFSIFIYTPLAQIKIYKEILRNVTIKSETEEKFIRMDDDISGGFTFIWKQVLLTLITIGFYNPWAVCKITKWYLDRIYISDYLEETEVV